MPTIDNLPQAKSLDRADVLALHSDSIGATVRGSLEQVAAVLLEVIEGAPDDTIYSLSTDAGGFTVVVLPAASGGSAWALITLDAPAAAGTIILPGIDDRAHGQEVLVTSTQTVAALTINALGAALSGAPSSIGPATPFRLKFDSISTTWYRI